MTHIRITQIGDDSVITGVQNLFCLRSHAKPVLRSFKLPVEVSKK